MTHHASRALKPSREKLGVLVPGMGAVATTWMAGVEAVKRGIGLPIGSLTQLGSMVLAEGRAPVPIREALPLAHLEDLVFGGWDVFPDSAYRAALTAKVLDKELIEELREPLDAIRPMKAVFDPGFVRKLNGTHLKRGRNKMELAEQLRADIRGFLRRHDLSRAVMVWCASTEAFVEPGPAQRSVKAFEEALRRDDAQVPPSMIYAYAALMEGVPFVNGAPNLTVDTVALQELSLRQGVPIAGKDFKSGQTLMKTVLAPMLKARMLGLSGWFSTNILGNRDGEVLSDPDSFRTKEVSKLSVLDSILEPRVHPELYEGFVHKVAINYYPPRGDNKEAWDNIDLVGWLGYPMQIKINFLCRDSILAAPLALDLALLIDLAQRCGLRGIQEWLSFYFKSPMVPPGATPEHDLFAQLATLQGTLRRLAEETTVKTPPLRVKASVAR